MKTFLVILAMLTAQLAAQDKQTQKIEPPQITAQPESEQASQTETPPTVQQPQIVVKPTAKPAQPPSSQQIITFTAEQLNEYENKILDRVETFYSNRMTQILRTVGVLVSIVVVIIPLFVAVLLPAITERQRRIRYAQELDIQSRTFNERLSQSEDSLKKYAEEQSEKLKDDLTKAICSPLSMSFSSIGVLCAGWISPEAYGLTLQSHVLAMKFYIISQCSGASLTASQIIRLFTYQDRGRDIVLDTLKAVDGEIENMKGDIEKIIDVQKRTDMKTQVQELQIFVHSLIQQKQQETDATPPQAG